MLTIWALCFSVCNSINADVIRITCISVELELCELNASLEALQLLLEIFFVHKDYFINPEKNKDFNQTNLNAPKIY